MKRITACSILCTVLASPGCGLVGSQVREVSPAPVGSGSSLETSANASEVSAARVSSPQVDTSGVEAVNFTVDQRGNDLARSNSVEPRAVGDSRVELITVSDPLAGDATGDRGRQLPANIAAASPNIAAVASYTLAELEQIALSNNPALAAADATASKAAGLWQQVGERPNPTMGYFGQQLANENTDQQGLFVEQEFVRGDKLKLNQNVLSHTTHAQRWEVETQRQRVLTDVRVRFFEAVAIQQQLDATRQFEQIARRGVEVALERKNAEEGTMIEVLQSETLLSETTLAIEQAEAAYRGAWSDLAAIAGLPPSLPARLDAELVIPQQAPDWEVTYSEIVAQSPEMSVANALVCEKSALLKRQQVQMVPNLTGQFGAGYDNATESGMINLELSAPIPVWNQNRGNISAAYADYARAVQNVERIEQAIKSRLARAAQDFDAAFAAVKKYEEEIIPQASQSLELSEGAYRAGELDFLQVLVVRRSFYESMIRLIEAKGSLTQANARVEGLLLTGGLVAPQDYTDGDGIRGASFGGQ